MSNPCSDPVKPEDVYGDNLWLSQHERHLLLTKESEPDVIFIGDTVISFLGQTQTWHDLFEPLHCLNFGIGSEKLQNTLWRIQDGILDNIKPKVVVILAGTNNTDDSPENIADSIIEIVKQVQSKLPSAYIVLMELLPRGRHRNPLWAKFTSVNSLLKVRASSAPLDKSRLEFITHDYSDLILREDSEKSDSDESRSSDQISASDFFDYIRLSDSGARKVFGPIHDIVLQLLGEDERDKDLSPVE